MIDPALIGTPENHPREWEFFHQNLYADKNHTI